jgi:Zn-dependent peptidase ImmA (M78 family)
MTRSTYYQQMRQLALDKRAEFGLTTRDISLSRLRKIYKAEGIIIDPCSGRLRKLKAAYFNDPDGCSVLLNMSLPEEPRLFAMLHELKHHYVDRDQLRCFCQDVYENSPVIEIGAEVFAAEILFPEEEFEGYVADFGITGTVTPEDVVRMKYHSPAKVSYQFLQKRLERLGLIAKGQFKGVQFYVLHKQMYGSQYYRQPRT